MILEEFITFIEGIGFKLDVEREVNVSLLSYSTLLDHSFEFSLENLKSIFENEKQF